MRTACRHLGRSGSRTTVLLRTGLLVVLGAAMPVRAFGLAIAIVVEGSQAATVRSKLVKACGADVTLTDEKSFAAALATAGARIGDLLSSERPSTETRRQLAGAARRVGATGALVARSVSVDRRQGVRVLVVAATSGEIVGDERVPVVRAVRKGRRTDWRDDPGDLERVLRRAFTALALQPAPLPATAASGTSGAATAAGNGARPSADGSASSSRAARPELIVASVALRQADRRFDYETPTPLPLRGYAPKLGAPGLALTVEIYPLAMLFAPLADLGLDVGFERAMGLGARPRDGESTIAARSQSWRAGMRWRWNGEGWRAGAGLAYGQIDFDFSGVVATGDLPAVAYRLLRLGGDGSLRLAPLEVVARVDLLWPFGGGAVATYFDPTWGLDLAAGARLPLFDALTTHALLRYTDVRSAGLAGGSAVDRFFGLELGVGYRL